LYVCIQLVVVPDNTFFTSFVIFFHFISFHLFSLSLSHFCICFSLSIFISNFLLFSSLWCLWLSLYIICSGFHFSFFSFIFSLFASIHYLSFYPIFVILHEVILVAQFIFSVFLIFS
jgi:hypothetical protein